ncbi:MAG: hypothetical protein IJE57_00395, partial [Anaerotignum sp.]|nr:hypothetical protein [Anaerotignum sp.]
EGRFSMEELEERDLPQEESDYEVKERAEADENSADVSFSYEENIPQPEEDMSHMRGYICPSCGAEIVTDDVTAATFCVFCGNPTLLPKQLEGEYRPAAILPFETDKEDAKKAFLNLCKGKKLLPPGYTSEQRLEKITGVYVPFWVFDCKADFDYHATGENVSTWSDLHFIYTKTDLYHIHRAGCMEFENIPLDASEKMQDDLMDALEPFHLEKRKDFDMSYLSGFLAEKYTYQPKDLYDRMTSRITPGVENKAGEGGRAYQRVYGVKCHTDFSSDKQTYMLLPVWMLISKYQGKDYLFAMNGQTGKIVGELPVSGGQAAKWFGIIFAITFIIAMAIAMFVTGGVF